jgi:hypothetical protein
VCLYVYVDRKRLGMNVTEATNTQSNNRFVEFVVFYAIRLVSKDSLCIPFVARQRFGKHVPVATRNCWKRRFQCGVYFIEGK